MNKEEVTTSEEKVMSTKILVITLIVSIVLLCIFIVVAPLFDSDDATIESNPIDMSEASEVSVLSDIINTSETIDTSDTIGTYNENALFQFGLFQQLTVLDMDILMKQEHILLVLNLTWHMVSQVMVGL